MGYSTNFFTFIINMLRLKVSYRVGTEVHRELLPNTHKATGSRFTTEINQMKSLLK